MLKKKYTLLYLLIVVYSGSWAQADSVWQAYYDSSEVYARSDWNKTAELFEKALAHLEATVPEYEMDSIYIVTLDELGYAYYRGGRYNEARPLFEEVLAKTEQLYGEDHPSYGTALMHLSMLHRGKGEYYEALALLQQTLSIYESTLGKDHAWYGETLHGMAVVYKESLQYDRALTYFREALANMERNYGLDHPTYGICMNNLAALYQDVGLYEEALQLSIDAVENIRQSNGPDDDWYGAGLMNLARLYYNMGRYEDALPIFTEVSVIYRRNLGEGHAFYANCLNNIAIVHQKMGNYGKAQPFYEEALSIYKRALGTEHHFYGIGLNNLGRLYGEMGRYEVALALGLESLENTIQSVGKGTDAYASGLNSVAMLYQKMGRYDDALPLYLEALDTYESVLGNEHPAYGHCINNLARLYCDMDRFDQAVPVILAANENVQGQIDRVFGMSSEKSKSDFLNSIENHFQLYHSLAFSSGYEYEEINQMLYDNELRLKGLVLNSTRKTLAAIEAGQDAGLTRAFNKWRGLCVEIARQYSMPVDQRSGGLDSLEQLANSLEEDLVRRSEAFETYNRQVSWREVRDALDGGEAAIEFVHFRYRDRTATDSIFYVAMLLTASMDKPRIIPVSEQEILLELLSRDKEISEIGYISNLYEPAGESAIYSILWSVLDTCLKDVHTIYFAPSGLLHQVGFETIPLPGGGYLSDRFQLVRLNSTRQLVIDQEQPGNRTVALFGGIDYQYALVETARDTVDEKLLASSLLPAERSGLLRNFNYLRGTLREVEHISQLFRKKRIKVKLLTGQHATESDFKSLSGNSPEVLHIATHGFFFPDVELTARQIEKGASFRYIDNPLFRCGLALAGANYTWQKGYNPYEEEDGILTAYEISNMDLGNTDLVVLSACETGLGEIRGSEGVYGLQRAFKMAGVDNLIMSLWQVPDQQTTELMELFYANWLEGYDIRSAFNKARESMSARYPPYYWAAFIMVGDVVEIKVPRKGLPIWMMVLAGVLLSSAIGLGVRRRVA